MDAIETLMTEHRAIERAIDALLVFTESSRRGASEDRAELGRFVTFIRDFADAAHHGKEEEILFASMVEAGFPRHAGPVAVMLHEHDLGRRFVGELDRLARQPEPWSAADRDALAEAALGYGQLLRAHIQKEDSILYPMAMQRLPEPLLRRVEEACAAFEARQAADGTQARLEALGRQLVTRHVPALEQAAG
jgi:hemerythrin-like domain-containing protein